MHSRISSVTDARPDATRRGAARSQTARLAILHATASQFAQRGWERLTIEGIAAEAGVGKQTIYRWWKSKAALVAECLLEDLLLPQSFVPPDTGEVRADLTTWLSAILRLADAPEAAQLFRSLVAAAAEDEQIGLQLREALGASSTLAARLERARGAGQLPAEAAIPQIGDALVGAVILRLIARAPAEPDVAKRLVAVVLGA